MSVENESAIIFCRRAIPEEILMVKWPYCKKDVVSFMSITSVKDAIWPSSMVSLESCWLQLSNGTILDGHMWSLTEVIGINMKKCHFETLQFSTGQKEEVSCSSMVPLESYSHQLSNGTILDGHRYSLTRVIAVEVTKCSISKNAYNFVNVNIN